MYLIILNILVDDVKTDRENMTPLSGLLTGESGVRVSSEASVADHHDTVPHTVHELDRSDHSMNQRPRVPARLYT